MLIVLYVDDRLVAGNDRSKMNEIKEEFKKRFKMKDLGEAKEFLGISITRNRAKRTLSISQSCYAEKVLQRFGMQDSKPCKTPMEILSSKATSESDDLDETPEGVP